MLKSLKFVLLLNKNYSDIFMEKHWKSVIHRSICDYFFEAQTKCAKPDDIPTVISTPHHKLILIYRNKLYFVAVVVNEGIQKLHMSKN